MIYELENTSKAKGLFEGWQETLITSCLQKVMGKIFVTDLSEPVSAFAFVGCFGFFAGKPDQELVKSKPKGFSLLTPQNRQWAELIEATYPDAKKVTRYAIRKDTRFDINTLKKSLLLLPNGYELKEIDAELYDKCLELLVCEMLFVLIHCIASIKRICRESNSKTVLDYSHSILYCTDLLWLGNQWDNMV